jgi:hypothetical protein
MNNLPEILQSAEQAAMNLQKRTRLVPSLEWSLQTICNLVREIESLRAGQPAGKTISFLDTTSGV